MIIIGELINGTRKAIKAAIAAKDADFIADLAKKQEEAGATFIDCNPGTTGDEGEGPCRCGNDKRQDERNEDCRGQLSLKSQDFWAAPQRVTAVGAGVSRDA